MAFIDEIDQVWKAGTAREADPAPLSGSDLQAIVASRVRKEIKTVGQFVWAAIVYQIILYSFLARTFVRNWGDRQIMLLCLAAAALYVPLTVALVRRVKTAFGPRQSSASSAPNIFHAVAAQHTRLAEFFRFKKRMDWIGVPITCAIIVLVTFTLFVNGGVQGSPRASLLLFALWIGMSVIAIRAENRKRFVSPLRRLQQILDDLKLSA